MREKTDRWLTALTMVGVVGKESTMTKLGHGAGQHFRLRPETYFRVTAQFVISLSLLSATTNSPERFKNKMVSPSRTVGVGTLHTNA